MKARDKGFYIETVHGDYKGYDDPIFFDKNAFAWVVQLEAAFDELVEELAVLFPNDSKIAANPETHIQFPPNGWKNLPFYFNGIKFRRNLRRFPMTADALSRIPHLISAAVSVLEPGARLLPHNGSTNAVMRVHLPLKVPAGLPLCGMRIDGQDVAWEEGRIFMFCDMKIHEVWNDTCERRFILLLDVVRPEFIHLKKEVCVHTIARILTNIIINLVKKPWA